MWIFFFNLPNIGLINSLATYCRVNKFGYIESPYKKVVNGKVTSEIKYLSAIEEEKFTIAQANSPLNKDGSFVEELVACRKDLNFELANRENIDYIDVSPKQLVSVAAALIHFLKTMMLIELWWDQIWCGKLFHYLNQSLHL